MSRVFIDGFEAQDPRHGLWSYSNHQALATDTNPPSFISLMIGSAYVYAWACGDNGRLRKYITATNEYYFGFTYWLETTPASGECAVLLAVYEDSTYNKTPLFVVCTDTDGHLKAVKTKDGTLLGGSADPVFDVIDTAKHVEVRIKTAADPDGRFEIKVDGTSVLSVSGGANLNEGTFEVVEVGKVSGVTTVDGDTVVGDGVYDNFVIDDAAFPGVTKIQMINPNGAGNSAQWAPSTGNNYECVDEAPPDFADYVKTNTIGDQDLYAMSDLAISPDSIKCVQVETSIRTLGIPSPQHIAHVLRIGTTNYQGADTAIPGPSASDEGGYKTLQTVWENSPATASAFTESEVNGMEAGVKATT